MYTRIRATLENVPLPCRVLALDVGKRRIGLAISDPLGITAQGLPTLHRTRLRDDVEALAEIVSEYTVGCILVGNPLHMSGDESAQGALVQEFARKVEKRTSVPVRYLDERLTTVEAERVLRESGIGLEKRRGAVDRLAAVLLLQSYLDARSAESDL